jgi:ABC-type transporter Mla MlaB component
MQRAGTVASPGPQAPHGFRSLRQMAGDAQLGEPREPDALRQAVAGALAGGASPERVYATVVRPTLAPFADGPPSATGTEHAGGPPALARSLAHAALAELAPAHPTSDDGRGRAAIVLVPPGLVGELDGQVLADALQSSSWDVEVVGLDGEPQDVVARIEASGPELVMVPASDGAQILAAERVCSMLRRLAQPPLVVGVAFGSIAAAPPALSLDHHLDGTDALAPLLHRRLGTSAGDAAWGVRMTRDGEGLVVAPVGLLDATTAPRLREIVETRRDLYEHITIDLSGLTRAEDAGLAALVAWDAERPWAPDVTILGAPVR